jgi:hypothetical protein
MATISKVELVKEVRDKIEFTIVIAIFFSSLLYMASKAAGSNDIQANSNGLIWGIAVSIHILNYLLIDLSGKEIKRNWFRWIKASLVLGILAFIPAIFFTVVYYNKTVPLAYGWILMGSLWAVLLMPAISFLLICGHLDWMAVKNMWKMARKKLIKS